jgi:hypothetical protein
METRHKPFIIVIILGVAGFMFWLYAPTFQNARLAAQSDQLPENALSQLPPPPPPPPVPYGGRPTPFIDESRDVVANGKHQLTGKVQKQNACDTLTTAVSVSKTKPEQVSIAFVTAPGSDSCTKTSSLEDFSLSFTASDKAILTASLNGKQTDLNLEASE